VPPSGEPILVRAESRVHRSDEFGRPLRRDMLHQKSYSQPSTTCSKNDFPTINLHVILILKVTAATAIQFRVIQLLTRYSQAVPVGVTVVYGNKSPVVDGWLFEGQRRSGSRSNQGARGPGWAGCIIRGHTLSERRALPGRWRCLT
jgi:hypothetical protein